MPPQCFQKSHKTEQRFWVRGHVLRVIFEVFILTKM